VTFVPVYLISGGVVLFGAYLVYRWGLSFHATARRIEDTPTTPVSRVAPGFVEVKGRVKPIEASSGTVIRHRLNRSGDRQLNRALHTIVLVRMRQDSATKAYVQRRLAQGKTIRDIKRCLKRYVARQLPPARSAALTRLTAHRSVCLAAREFQYFVLTVSPAPPGPGRRQPTCKSDGPTVSKATGY
jgi:hypothetical protein